VRDHQGRAYAVAYHYVRNQDVARDLAQEAFVRVYQKLDSYAGQDFLPWLIRLVRNLCIDHLRRRKARPPLSDVPAEDSDVGRAIPDRGPGPEELWLTDTRKRLVYDALRRMTGPDREMILLKEIQGLKFREIAELLDLPVGTVKSRSNRARVELAQQVLKLDPSYGESGSGTDSDRMS
jgi:RNA polymerase sigma-70 factor (ECF subfamily)